MGLLDRLKGKKENINWNDAYTSTPKFYKSPTEESAFGAISLTEGTKTILPKNPQNQYKVDNQKISDWRIVLISTTKNSIIGDADYFSTLTKLDKYIIDTKKDTILIRPLSFNELDSLK